MNALAPTRGSAMPVDRRAFLANGGVAVAAGGSASLPLVSSARAEDSDRASSARPTWITFDVYGTLSQWDQSLAAAIREILHSHDRPDADVQLATNACNAEALRLEAVGAFRSYRAILREALRPALATAGLARTSADGDLLIDRLSRVPPFPEVPRILAELARDYKLSPITNSDDAFIAGTLEALGPVFATTVTAEQAQAYKPNPGLFRFALHKLGIEPSQLLHVAIGTFPDLAVCTALGIRVVWVDRLHQALQKGLEPIATIDDLTKLPALVRSV